MNERIQELAEQARKYARDYVAECKHYGHYMEQNEYELRFEQTFAQLIVRECATLVDAAFDIDEHSGEVVSYADGGQLKEHFGVEE